MKQHVTIKKTRAIVDFKSEDVVKRDDVLASDNVTPIGPDHELALLNTRLGELEALLEKAQRRIERLLGERNQLGALLDKRDEQIQQLYREMGTRYLNGAAEASPLNAPASWRALFSILAQKILGSGRTVQSRLSSMGSAKRSKDETSVAASTGFKRAPLVANFKTAAPKAVLAVLLFGLNEDEIKNLLPVIERDCQSSDMMPLLLTDNDAFELLREHNLIFEYLPPVEDRQRFDRDLSWNLYVQRRLAIIRQKWQPTRVIALGQTAADTLRLWQQSPFEEIPLPASAKT